MQDRFTDFCNDDAVQEALCDIVQLDPEKYRELILYVANYK